MSSAVVCSDGATLEFTDIGCAIAAALDLNRR
jgi:hypothetical protein